MNVSLRTGAKVGKEGMGAGDSTSHRAGGPLRELVKRPALGLKHRNAWLSVRRLPSLLHPLDVEFISELHWKPAKSGCSNTRVAPWIIRDLVTHNLLCDLIAVAEGHERTRKRILGPKRVNPCDARQELTVTPPALMAA